MSAISSANRRTPKGDKSKDVPLLSGDVIYIPPLGQLVAISGSVNLPAMTEVVAEAPAPLVAWALKHGLPLKDAPTSPNNGRNHFPTAR